MPKGFVKDNALRVVVGAAQPDQRIRYDAYSLATGKYLYRGDSSLAQLQLWADRPATTAEMRLIESAPPQRRWREVAAALSPVSLITISTANLPAELRRRTGLPVDIAPWLPGRTRLLLLEGQFTIANNLDGVDGVVSWALSERHYRQAAVWLAMLSAARRYAESAVAESCLQALRHIGDLA